MEDRFTEFLVGIVLLATIIVAGILFMFFGGGVVAKQYTLFIRFDQAPGVTVDTPVRKSGVLVGRVSQVDLLDTGGVLVTTKIDSSRAIRRSEVCRIRTGNFLGDAELEFVPGQTQVAATDVWTPGSYLDGMVAQNPLSALETFVDMEGEIRDALASIKGAGEDVGRAAESLNGLLVNNQDRIASILLKAESSMDRFEFAMASIDEFVRDDALKQKVTQTLDEVPALLADARDLMSTLKSAAGRVERNLENIEGLTEPLGEVGAIFLEKGESVFLKVDGSLDKLDVLMEQLVVFSRNLNNSDGTLNALMTERELYDRINQAVVNIEEVTYRLRPIVNDARVFTDKIARNPAQLGVRGALTRRSSGIKY